MKPALIDPRDVIRKVAHERAPALVVASPPGGGKTRLAVAAASYCASLGDRAIIATLSNLGADDVAVRALAHIEKHKLSVPVVRLLGRDRSQRPAADDEDDPLAGVQRVYSAKEIPEGPCVAITTLAKLATSAFLSPFDLGVFDEAFLASFADLLASARAVSRLLLIGDPGQIGPVVEANVAPWSHLGWGPHRGAGVALLALRRDITHVGLRHSFRLQPDVVSLVGPVFYEKYPFDSQARPLNFSVGAGSSHWLDALIDRGCGGPDRAMSAGLLPGSCESTPDRVMAAAAAHAAARIRQRGLPADRSIAIIASRREQVAVTRDISARLFPELHATWSTETSDRVQGLEYDVVIAQYPLGGPREPSSFDLLAGRLCVTLTRSRGYTLLLAREDAPKQLGGSSIREEAGDLSADDPSYLGRRAHRSVWRWLSTRDRILRLAPPASLQGESGG